MSAQTQATLNGIHLGTSSSVITPEAGREMSGFIARVDPMEGVHDDHFVKVMVWAEDAALTNAAALVTFDLIDLEPDFVALIRDRAAARSGIESGRIGLTCTHTHGGPATLFNSKLGEVDRDYLDRVAKITAETVAAAAKVIEPVIYTWGVGSETTVGKNRRSLDGIIDPDVPVIRFQRADGSMAALFVSYACHPVTLGPDNLLATADYPGYVRRTLEAAYPGAHVQFATGCCGQINNGHTSRDGIQGRGSYWRTFGEAERIGRAIAGAALQAAEQSARIAAALPILETPVEPSSVSTNRRSIDLPFLPPPGDAEMAEFVSKCQTELSQIENDPNTSKGEFARLDVYMGWADKINQRDFDASASAEVQTISIGDVSLVLLPGESFVEFGLEIKERGGSEKIITLAYANGRPGYIPHRSAYPAGGYEVDDAYRYYGSPACFAPEAGELVVETGLELLADTRSIVG